MSEERAPQFLIRFAQNLSGLPDRHLTHQRQSEGFKLLRQSARAPFPRRPHGVHLAARFALATWRRAHDLRLQLAHVEMAPGALRRMIVTGDRFGVAVRTGLAGPQGRSVLNSNEHLGFLLHVINLLNSPAIAQRQNLMKHFLWNHKMAGSLTYFRSFYPLQTSRNQFSERDLGILHELTPVWLLSQPVRWFSLP